jgi:hypothetical protein
MFAHKLWQLMCHNVQRERLHASAPQEGPADQDLTDAEPVPPSAGEVFEPTARRYRNSAPLRVAVIGTVPSVSRDADVLLLTTCRGIKRSRRPSIMLQNNAAICHKRSAAAECSGLVLRHKLR